VIGGSQEVYVATSHHNPSSLSPLAFRFVGPWRGGRVVAVASHTSQPLVYYFGSTGGGVWKSANAGASWFNVSDGAFARASVGAIGVAPSDPNVIYVGMGETTTRNSVSHGDGVYRSTDGGRTWAHLGLRATRNIARVAVHPNDPDRVYVAALGHVFGPNSERGVYRSRDGGATWDHVLFRSDRAGAADLAIDPLNPRVLYATLWEGQRMPWGHSSGGPGSGLFRSTDGGVNWTDLSLRPGMPEGVLGKMGVAPSPAREGRVWLIAEAVEGGLFRSDDHGETWHHVNDDFALRTKPSYYMHVVADPKDENTVYVPQAKFWKSVDGGATFAKVATPHDDNHGLWIDPADNRRMILGHDGGASVSSDGGSSWSDTFNQPTAEFYHVTTDQRQPYRIYGAQQDHGTWSVPSRSDRGRIVRADEYDVGGSESGFIAVRPDNPDVVYAGGHWGIFTRYDHSTREQRDIRIWPEICKGWGAKDQRYRFNWSFPILLSPHDPDTLYAAANCVFRTRDEGARWEVMSPDLTLNDVTKLGRTGGPITYYSGSGSDFYCTISVLAASPHNPGTMWSGSDDGLVHVTEDDGASWRNVTPPGLPKWALVSSIDVSSHDANTVYVAATAYRLDDFRPYVFFTTDAGRTWTRIDAGLPEDEFVRVVREDPAAAGFLVAGTEAGVHVSPDHGATWLPLQLNLPAVPVHDLLFVQGDLVLGTHGRGFWILDDVMPLRHAFQASRPTGPHVLSPRPVVRRQRDLDGGKDAVALGFIVAGDNPPAGAVVHYWLDEVPTDGLSLTITDSAGTKVRTYHSPRAGVVRDGDGVLSTAPGLNRVVWDLRYPGPVRLRGYAAVVKHGPLAPPGTYTATLEAGSTTSSATFEIVIDPRVSASVDELRRQFDYLITRGPCNRGGDSAPSP